MFHCALERSSGPTISTTVPTAIVRPLAWLCIPAGHPNVRICRGQGRAPQARQDLGRAMWSVGSRELCEPRTEADGNPVTESNLSLDAPGKEAFVLRDQVLTGRS